MPLRSLGIKSRILRRDGQRFIVLDTHVGESSRKVALVSACDPGAMADASRALRGTGNPASDGPPGYSECIVYVGPVAMTSARFERVCETEAASSILIFLCENFQTVVQAAVTLGVIA